MDKQSKTKVLIKNTLWVYMAKGVTQIIALVSSILVIRQLDVEIFGTFNFLLGSILVFNILGISPFVDILNRYIPELITGKQKSKLDKITFFAFGASILITLALIVIMFFFKQPIGKFFNIDKFSVYIIEFAVYIFFMLFRSLSQSVLTSLLLHKQSSLLLIQNSVVRSVLYLIFLKKLDVNFLLYIESMCALLYFIPGFIIYQRYLRKIQTGKVVMKDLSLNQPVTQKRIVKYGVLSFLNQIGAAIVGKTSDYYIISAMSNLQNVGLYGFAFKLYDMMYKFLPVNEFMTVLRPIFFQKFTENYSKKSINDTYNFIVKFMIPVFGLPFFYILFFGKPIINFVFDPKYINAYTVTCIVLFTNVLTAVFFPQDLVIQLKERVDIALKSKIVVIFSIIGGIFGMKYFGIIGVASATLLGQFVKNMYMYYILSKDTGIDYRLQTFKNYVIVFAILCVIFMPFMKFYNSIEALAAGTILFAVLSVFLLIFFHPYNDDDLQLFTKIENSSKTMRKAGKIIRSIHAVKLNLMPKMAK